MKLVAQSLGLRVDDYLNVARAEAPAQAEEAEREARRNLEARDEYVPPALERLLDALLYGRAPRHVHEVCERALTLPRPPAPEQPLSLRRFEAAARLHDDGEGRQHALRVVDRDDDGRGVSREDVVGEARAHGEVAQACAPGRPRHEERRGEHGEYEEEQVVAGVPRRERDDRVDAYEDDAARRQLNPEVEPRGLRARRPRQRRHDEDDYEQREEERRNRPEPRQLPVAPPARDDRDDGRAHAAQHDERAEHGVSPALQLTRESHKKERMKA